MALGRALHFVFKIGDRKAAAKFYRDILGMQVRKLNKKNMFVFEKMTGIISYDDK